MSQQTDQWQEWLTIYLKGIAMGATDTLPGASGGTIALIAGIYKRLIDAISSLDPHTLLLVTDIHTEEGREKLKTELVRMDVPFLLVLGLGIVTAIISIAQLVHIALQQYRGLTFAFFLGLILASAIILYWNTDITTAEQIGAGYVGFMLAFLTAQPTVAGSLPHTPLVIMGSGMIAITAMILPGISGAFLLLVLGQYEFLTATLTRLTDQLIIIAQGGPVTPLFGPAIIVSAFMVGAVIGLLSTAKLIKQALERYRAATLTFLISLMLGALRAPIREIATATPTFTTTTVWPLAVATGLGGASILILNHYTDDLTY